MDQSRLVSELVSAADGGKLLSWFSDVNKLTERFNVEADFRRCSLNVGGGRCGRGGLDLSVGVE